MAWKGKGGGEEGDQVFFLGDPLAPHGWLIVPLLFDLLSALSVFLHIHSGYGPFEMANPWL